MYWFSSRITTLIKDLAEERQMSKAFQSNQSSWLKKYAELEETFAVYKNEKSAEINELKEEIRDLMFYMEAQNTIAKSDIKDEYLGSTVSMPSTSEQAAKAAATAKPKKKKK